MDSSYHSKQLDTAPRNRATVGLATIQAFWPPSQLRVGGFYPCMPELALGPGEQLELPGVEPLRAAQARLRVLEALVNPLPTPSASETGMPGSPPGVKEPSLEPVRVLYGVRSPEATRSLGRFPGVSAEDFRHLAGTSSLVLGFPPGYHPSEDDS